jgi:hypothetical protein
MFDYVASVPRAASEGIYMSDRLCFQTQYHRYPTISEIMSLPDASMSSNTIDIPLPGWVNTPAGLAAQYRPAFKRLAKCRSVFVVTQNT